MPMGIAQKIIDEIGNSIALFALITSNVLFDQETRDWVVFEIGIAKGKGKRVYCWIDKGWIESIPKLVPYITDYDKFDSSDHKDRLRMAEAMVNKALEIEEEEW